MTLEPAQLDWSPQGEPRSRLYGDVYFSAEDGLAESQAVFLGGCGLPQAWANQSRFTVGELGFGSGLNILALLAAWRDTAPLGAHLHIFSVEAHLMTAQDAQRALARWPQLGDLANLLLAQWPARARGLHRLDFHGLKASLDVAVMEVVPALTGWTGQADAWFLDGFSPALNPAMWTLEVLELVAKRSAPGARVASFTVAGDVRRGLERAGFAVRKAPGFGRKRQRLEAVLPGFRSQFPGISVAVIGAGIAGASVMRALNVLGGNPILVESEGLGSGASGNPAALVTPRLDAGLGPVAQLTAQAFRRAVQLYEAVDGAVLDRGVLQLALGPRDPGRFAKVATSDLFEPGALTPLSPAQASARLGEPTEAEGIDLNTALVVAPHAILQAWTSAPRIAKVSRLEPWGGGWRLLNATGGVIAQVDRVVLASGQAADDLAADLDLRPVRGQASWARAVQMPAAAAWGGYVVPMGDQLLFGATHDRGDTGTDLRPADHLRNLEALALARPGLAGGLKLEDLAGRAAIRATTADSLPLAGAATAPGLFLLTGFGSHGFSLAPLMGEHVAAMVLGAPSPLPAGLAALVDPARFARRAARRGLVPGERLA